MKSNEENKSKKRKNKIQNALIPTSLFSYEVTNCFGSYSSLKFFWILDLGSWTLLPISY